MNMLQWAFVAAGAWLVVLLWLWAFIWGAAELRGPDSDDDG